MAAPPQTTRNTAFFYGTLMATPVLSRVIYGTTSPESWQIASLRIRPAVLDSYCRHQVRFVDYPGIVPESGKTVRGTFVEGLTEGDVYRLDIFEGSGYQRRKVRVKILDSSDREGNEQVETETYVWVAGRDKLKDEEWDFQEFVKSKLVRWIGSSQEYAEVDEANPLGARWWQAGFQPKDDLEPELEPKENEQVSAEEIRNKV